MSSTQLVIKSEILSDNPSANNYVELEFKPDINNLNDSVRLKMYVSLDEAKNFELGKIYNITVSDNTV